MNKSYLIFSLLLLVSMGFACALNNTALSIVADYSAISGVNQSTRVSMSDDGSVLFGGSIFSLDGGQTWNRTSLPFNLTTQNPAVFVSFDNSFWLTSYADGIYRSVDNGSSWTLTNITSGSATYFSCNRAGFCLSSTSFYGTLFSNDSGVTWDVLNATMLSRTAWISNNSLDIMLTTTSSGSVLYSSDGGLTFSSTNTPASSSIFTVLCNDDLSKCYAGYGSGAIYSLIYSTDKFSTITYLNDTNPLLVGVNIRGLSGDADLSEVSVGTYTTTSAFDTKYLYSSNNSNNFTLMPLNFNLTGFVGNPTTSSMSLNSDKVAVVFSSSTFGAVFMASNSGVCVPYWVQDSPTSCNGILSNFTVSYSDLNSCGTSTNLPVDNGSVVYCPPFDYSFVNLSSSNSGDWAFSGSSVKAVAFDSVHNLVYTGVTQSAGDSWLGVYNISSNSWTGIRNHGAGRDIVSNGVIFDSVNNMVFYGMGTCLVGVYNASNNVSSTLAPFGLGGCSINSLAYDSVNGFLFVGSTADKFGYYSSNFTWINLSTTDSGNWAGTISINSLLYANGLVYTGMVSGKFGVYNSSSNVWSDLSATDTANWVGTAPTLTLTYDPVNNLVYTGGAYGSFSGVGIYNPSSNVWIQGFTYPNLYGAGATLLSFDYLNNIFYVFGGSPPSFYAYEPISNRSVSLNYTGVLSTTLYPYNVISLGLDAVNNKLYVGSNSMVFGILNHSSPCVETWVRVSNNTCDSANKQLLVSYFDSHQCGTSNSVPLDNGSFEYCCIPSWGFNNSVCDGSFYTRNYYDVYGCGNFSSLPVDNGTVLSCAIDNSTYIFEQLPFNSTGVFSLSSDPVHNLLYIGSSNALMNFGVYNLSNNVFTDLSATDTGNFWGVLPMISVYYDSVYDLVYTGGTSKFGRYNRSSNVWTDLSATDTKLISGATATNWAGSQQVSSMASDSVNGLIYTSMGNGLFGVYNLSNNTWFSLSNQDPNNWVGTAFVSSVAYDSVNGLVYTGMASGKFGVYNVSSLVWSDLSATDSDNWLGTQLVNSVAFDSVHNLVYLITSAGMVGVYNPVTNLSIKLNISSIAMAGTSTTILSNAKLSYDSVNDLLYTVNSNARIGVYNPSTNVWSNVKDINRWLNPSSIPAVVFINDSIYVGSSGSSSVDGFLGRRVLVSCVENWLPLDSSCNGFTYIVGYYDSNSCGTSNYVPSDNGTIERCNFNYSLDTWYDLSYTDKLPEYNWVSNGQAYPIGSFNGSTYFTSSAYGFGGLLSVYNPLTNIFSIVPNVFVGGNPFMVGDIVYGNTVSNPVFGSSNLVSYNLSSGVYSDLSSSDPNNWAGTGTYSIQSFTNVNNLIFTRIASLGLFGFYNVSDGVWYNSSLVSDAMARGFLNSNNVMLGDSDNNLLYIGFQGYPTQPPYINALGVYNVSNNSLDIYTWYNSSSNAGFGQVRDMVLVGDTLYIGSGSASGIALVTFNTSSKTFIPLSTADVGDWVNNSGVNNHGLAVDSVHNLIYTSLSSNKFGVYNISSGIWYNHSILGDTSVGDELTTSNNYLFFDSLNEVLYSGDTGGLHVYRSPFTHSCNELWISNNSVCDGSTYTVKYYDLNSCGSILNLPVNNGSSVSCGALCTPNWSQNIPMSCNGILSNFTISYSDLNVCNVSTNLPVNNGSSVSCCVENFVQNNTACTGYSFVAGYIDLNSCGTTFTLPSDNSLTIPCTLEARTSGGTGGRSVEVTVPVENVTDNLITGAFLDVPSDDVSIFTRWWTAIVKWINGWWYS